MTRLRILMMLVAGAAMLLAACSSRDSEAPATAEPTAGSSSTESTQSSTPSSTQSIEPSNDFVPDYAALVATVEVAMEGTAYEGAAVEDVEVFIATAELFCDLLGEGMTTDQVLADYLDRLSDGGEIEVDEDDGLMAGVLLGAAVEIVCPEHAQTIP